jgi:hypothetical protein
VIWRAGNVLFANYSRTRALVELDRSMRAGPGRVYPSGTRALMVHARSISQPSGHKYFPATITQDDQQPLQPGEHAVVTITVTDDDAPSYLAPGQTFTIWATTPAAASSPAGSSPTQAPASSRHAGGAISGGMPS